MTTNNSTNNWSPLTTKGDLFTYDTAPNRLAIGSNYYFPQADSTQSVGLSYQLPIFQPQICTYLHVDFLGSNNGDGSVNTNAVGTGTTNTLAASLDGTHFGLFKIGMGTTTTGYSQVFSGNGTTIKTLIISTDTITIETCVYLSALSNGTDTYTFTFGALDVIPGSGTTNNGVYVSYNSGTNSGNFVLTAKNGVGNTTSTNTSTTWTGAATWYKLRLVINGTTSATLWGAAAGSDFTSLGTVSSNLPTTGIIPWAVAMLKSAGTTDVYAYVDYVQLRIVPATTR